MATPEIAMTNGGPSRRIACKVRCGGEQPACEKCRRAGEQCVYLPTQKPSKADLAQTVEELQKRLDRSQISLLIKTLTLDDAKDEAEALIDRLKASSNGTTHTSPSSRCFSTPANLNAENAPLATVHVSSEVYEKGLSDSMNGGNDFDLSYNEQGIGPPEPSQPVTHQQTPRREIELPPFSMDEYMNIDPLNAAIYPQDGFSPHRGIDEETGAAILEPITRFSSAIFRTQADTLVMASVVADYIAWLRKAPPGGGIPNVSESPVYLGMLDNLESRLRELCEMSQSQSNGALQELVASLGAIAPPGGTMAARLSNLQEDLQKEARERAEVFRSRYNPCALLSNQARNTSE